MKENFDFFYDFYNEEKLKSVWNEESTVFIFDTNILLDLYRYKFETQKNFFEYLDKIKDRSWLPYHVGIEFYNNRIKVIRNRQKAIKNVDTVFENVCQISELKLTTLTDQYRKEEHDEIYTAIESLEKKLKAFQTEINEAVNLTRNEIKDILEPNIEYAPHLLAEKDKILQKLESIFTTNNIATNLYQNQDAIEALFKEAKSRWSKGFPPGYKDYLEKNDESFIYQDLIYYKALGDLIIFNEIKNYAASNENITNIIFISNDAKEDWKHIESFQGNKDLGCRHELRYELQSFANNIKFFEIIDPFQFLAIFSKYQGKELSKTVEDDVRNISIISPLTEYIKKKNLSNESIKNIVNTIKSLDSENINQLHIPTIKNSKKYNVDINDLIKNVAPKLSIDESKKDLNWENILIDDNLTPYEKTRILRSIVHSYYQDYIRQKELLQLYENMLKHIDKNSQRYVDITNFITDIISKRGQLEQIIDEINSKIDSLNGYY